MPPSLRSRETGLQSSPIKLPTRTSERNIRQRSQPLLGIEAPSTATSNRRQSNRASSADSPAGIGQRTSIRVIRNNERSKPQQPLPTVVEDAVILEQAAGDVHDDVFLHDAASNSGLSSNSGMTNAEVEELQRNSHITTTLLSNLGQDAHFVLDLIAPRNTTEANCTSIGGEVSIPNSRIGRILQNFSESFEPFAGGLNPWIRPESVLRALFKAKSIQDIRMESRSPENIMLLANLAELMKDAFQLNDLKRQTTLQTIDNTFPRPFITSLTDSKSHGFSQLLEATFNTALSIRTQLAIALLRRRLADPDNQLLAVFFDQDDPTLVKSWNIAGFEDVGGAMLPEFEMQIQQRVEKIRTSFSSHAVDVDFEKLEADFPWSLFLLEMCKWARIRADEIVAHVAKEGGMDTVVKEMANNIQHHSTEERRESEAEFDMSTTKRSKRFLGLGKLKEMSGAGFMPKPSQILGHDVTNHSTILPNNRECSVPPMGDDDGQDPESEINPVAVGTKRSIMDPQPGARRITFNESQELGASQKPVTSHEQHSTEPSGFDPTPDTGFQLQQSTNADQRREEATAALAGRHRESPGKRRPLVDASPPQSKRPRHRRAQDEDEEYVAPIREGRRGNATREIERVGTIRNEIEDYSEDDEIPSSTYSRANAMSKRKTNLHNRHRTPQTRIPWSPQECKYFEYLIDKYGPGYATIQKHDAANNHLFHLRDQVALKDKARNMKFDYMKSGVPLPSGFEHVVMKKSHVEQLRDRYGITMEDQEEQEEHADEE